MLLVPFSVNVVFLLSGTLTCVSYRGYDQASMKEAKKVGAPPLDDLPPATANDTLDPSVLSYFYVFEYDDKYGAEAPRLYFKRIIDFSYLPYLAKFFYH